LTCPINILGEEVEDKYKYLGVQRITDWTEAVSRKGQRRLYFLRKL